MSTMQPQVSLGYSSYRETTGINKGEWTTVWGITVLLFNEDKISEAAAIYQPFPGMREALIKA